MPDVERAGHRLQQPTEAVDAFPAQLVALDDCIVLEGETKQIDHVVQQFLVSGAEGTLAARGNPERAMHARPLTNRAHDTRARCLVHDVELGGGIANEMFGDFDVPGFVRDVQHEGISAIEPKDVQALEWNRHAKRAGYTGNHFAKTRRLCDQTRNGREHVYGISLEHS
jgi:hypothetical protein